MATDEAAESEGRGGLVVLTSDGVDVGNVDLHAPEVIGGKDTVGPRARGVRRMKKRNLEGIKLVVLIYT